MAIANLGSIATTILSRINNVPASISGAMVGIVDETRLFMEIYTGETIGSVAILEKYQPAMVSLASADVLELMNTQGGNYASISLGELSVSKGKDNNIMSTAGMLKDKGMRQLNAIGKSFKYRQVFM